MYIKIYLSKYLNKAIVYGYGVFSNMFCPAKMYICKNKGNSAPCKISIWRSVVFLTQTRTDLSFLSSAWSLIYVSQSNCFT